MTRSLLAILTVVLCAVPSAEARVRAVRHVDVWTRPACSGIQGLASIRFLEPNGTVRKSYFHAVNEYAYPITAGVVPNTLYTTYDGNLFESRNAGCSWTLRTPLPEIEVPYEIVVSRERIYVLADLKLVRIAGPATEVFDLPARVAAMAVNPASSLHLRALAQDGTFYESRDGGIVWDRVGALPPPGSIYSVAFDPANFDHVLVGVYPYGSALTTRDGGRTWTHTPFPSDVIAYTIAFSPADPNVVWMIGYDLTAKKLSLYRSNDGGTTFAPRLESPALQRIVVPHPRDPNVVATSLNLQIAIVGNDGVTVLPAIYFEKMLWAPSGTLYFTAPDEWQEF